MFSIPKYIKRNLLFISLCTVIFQVTSCEKLIEIPSNAPNQIITSQVFADSADAVSAIVQLYTNFSYVVLGLQAGGLTIYPALSADELMSPSPSNSLITECYANSIPVADNNLLSAWSGFYGSSTGGIYQANACIAGISASSGISTSLKNQLIGEAEVVRAFLYFQLVNWFGGVPLVLTNDYIVNQSLPRATDSAVYHQIISDLQDAKQRLLPTYPSDGKARPNLYTASALLSKVYLYTRDWGNALQESASIINSGRYNLETDLNNVFLRGSNEAIWQVQSIWSWIQTTEGVVFLPWSNAVIPNYILTPFQVNAFDPGDLRLSKWVNSNLVPSGDSTIKYYYPYKYKNSSAPAPTIEDYMIFRLGEQYLIHSEAASETGDQATAISDLNAIRIRAGLAGYAGPEDPDSVQVAILHERQVELFCEFGNRWCDLKRTGRVNAVLTAEKPTTWPADGHAVLYPIPQDQIQKNHLLGQNVGY